MGCSRRTLTESRAKTLLEENFRTEPLIVSDVRIHALLGASSNDYKTFPSTDTGVVLLKMLMASGLVVQTSRGISYEYAFSPTVKTFPVTDQFGMVYAGKFIIGDVTDLQLVGETRATAHFAWKAEKDNVGNIMLAARALNGIANAEFVKKPDGTWILAPNSAEYIGCSLSKCMGPN